jgi:hypothetical protein
MWSSFVASACDGEPSDAEDRPDPDEPPDFPSDPIANGSELPEVVSFPASLESNPVVAAPGLPYDFWDELARNPPWGLFPDPTPPYRVFPDDPTPKPKIGTGECVTGRGVSGGFAEYELDADPGDATVFSDATDVFGDPTNSETVTGTSGYAPPPVW